jgi:hypothetical protein
MDATLATRAGLLRPLTTNRGAVYEGVALDPAGLILLVASGWISEGMAAGSRALARWGAR